MKKNFFSKSLRADSVGTVNRKWPEDFSPEQDTRKETAEVLLTQGWEVTLKSGPEEQTGIFQAKKGCSDRKAGEAMNAKAQAVSWGGPGNGA